MIISKSDIFGTYHNVVHADIPEKSRIQVEGFVQYKTMLNVQDEIWIFASRRNDEDHVYTYDDETFNFVESYPLLKAKAYHYYEGAIYALRDSFIRRFNVNAEQIATDIQLSTRPDRYAFDEFIGAFDIGDGQIEIYNLLDGKKISEWSASGHIKNILLNDGKIFIHTEDNRIPVSYFGELENIENLDTMNIIAPVENCKLDYYDDQGFINGELILNCDRKYYATSDNILSEEDEFFRDSLYYEMTMNDLTDQIFFYNKDTLIEYDYLDQKVISSMPIGIEDSRYYIYDVFTLE